MEQYNILLADDDAQVLSTISMDLESYGYHTATASNGEEAVELLSKNTFDLVITGLLVEPVDGRAVLKKAKELNPETMVIILNNHNDLSSVFRTIGHDPDDYMVKPCNPEEIHFKVEKSLNELELKKKIKKQNLIITKMNEKLRKETAKHEHTIETLMESEEKFRTIFENANDEIAFTTPDGRFIDINNKVEDIFGYKPEEVIGKDIYDFLKPEDLARSYGLIEKIGDGQTTPIMEFEALRRDRTAVFIEVNSKLVKKNEHIIGVIHIIRDVTGRKKAEAALKESEKKYKTIFELVPTSIVLTDTNGSIIDANEYYLSHIAGDKDSKGKYIGENILTDPSIERAGLSEKYKRLIDGETIDEKGVYFPIPTSGTDSYFNIKGVPFKKNGEVTGSIIIHEDVTNLKQTEFLLQKHQKNLEKLVKERTENLKEINIALEVLLRKRWTDKATLCEQIMHNVQELITPLIKKIKKSRLDSKQQNYINILESNLNDIVSPFAYGFSINHLKLTSSEIQVANLVKQGKSTKDIADLLNMSLRTIDAHRYNIRKKLGISNTKTSLARHLSSFNNTNVF